MVRGEGTAVAKGVTPDEVFDFVLDPAQYTKADTKMVWVTKLADTPDGMLAREDGKFLGRFRGSVITRYRWDRPSTIDVTLEHGVPRRSPCLVRDRRRRGWNPHPPRRRARPRARPSGLDPRPGGRDLVRRSVDTEVAEIARLLEAGQRGRGVPDGPDHGG